MVLTDGHCCTMWYNGRYYITSISEWGMSQRSPFDLWDIPHLLGCMNAYSCCLNLDLQISAIVGQVYDHEDVIHSENYIRSFPLQFIRLENVLNISQITNCVLTYWMEPM